MILKIKAFIFRFSDIFGLYIYLATKEEKRYLETLEFDDDMYKMYKNIYTGMWQAQNGFTTIWTYKMPIYKAIIAKTKHAFDFKDYND